MLWFMEESLLWLASKKWYENIQNHSKDCNWSRNDYKIDCLLDYPYLKIYYKMIAMDICKQQALDLNPKAIQQIKFTGSLDRAGNTTMFFVIEEMKETIFGFFSRNRESIMNSFCFNVISI